MENGFSFFFSFQYFFSCFSFFFVWFSVCVFNFRLCTILKCAGAYFIDGRKTTKKPMFDFIYRLIYLLLFMLCFFLFKFFFVKFHLPLQLQAMTTKLILSHFAIVTYRVFFKHMLWRLDLRLFCIFCDQERDRSQNATKNTTK